MVELLRAGAITPNDTEDYCMRVSENLDIFSNNSKAIDAEEMELMQKYILDNLPHDIIVVDVDVNVNTPIAKHAFEKSQLIVVTLTQSKYIQERFAQTFTEPDLSKILFYCNYYSPRVGTLRTFAAGLPGKNRAVGLRYSETLIKLSNTGEINKLINAAKTTPLPGVENDLKNIVLEISRRLGLKGVWK
jgi:hypothetical protein